MNYLITKDPPGDSRKGICGVLIPDGFFVVVEYTEDNQAQLQNIKKLPGDMYKVTKTTLPVGHYAPNGCRVTLGSIWDWHLYNGKLEYVDGEPIDEIEIVNPNNKQRPPDVSAREEYVGLDDLGDDPDVDLPDVVMKARENFKRFETNKAPVAPVAHTINSEIDLESDSETLSAAGATDEVAMLRAQLDAKGIRYHPTAQAPALRKKLA